MFTLFSNADVKPSLSVPQSYSINCPFCITVIGKADTHYHLNFNTEKGVYRCPRCNSAGSLKYLRGYENLVKPSCTLSTLRAQSERLFRKPPHTLDLNEVSWPLTKTETPIAYQYITERGFTEEDIRTYGLRVGTPYFDDNLGYEVKKWSGRILFPYFNSAQECVYFIGRSYTGKEPRYLNSEGSKSTLLYNLDKVQGTCIICEGIISSIMAQKVTGVPAVALLGKSINTTQVSLIRSKCTEVYLSLDGDTQSQERLAIKRALLQAGLKVKMVNLPVIQEQGKKLKDPDDLKSLYLGLFETAQVAVL